MEISLFLVLSILLLIAGIAASFTPIVPAGILSIGGLLLYWWSTGYTEPGNIAFTMLILTGVMVLFFDWFAGFIGAKVGGATSKTALIATTVGFILLFMLGPLGLLVGIPATVFLLEYQRKEDLKASRKAAIYTTASILGSAFVQAFLTFLILAGFSVSVLI